MQRLSQSKWLGTGGVHTGDLCGVERTLCGDVFGDEIAHFVLGF